MVKRNMFLMVCLIISQLGRINCIVYNKSDNSRNFVDAHLKKNKNIKKIEKYVYDINAFNFRDFDQIMINSQEKYFNRKLKKTDIFEKKILTDFNNKLYVCYEFVNGGYSIISIENYDVIECAPDYHSPFYGHTSNLYYCPRSGYFKRIGKSFYNIFNNKKVDQLSVESLKQKCSLFLNASLNNINFNNMNILRNQKNDVVLYGNAPDGGSGSGEQHTAPIEVDNSWYFKENKSSYFFAEDHSFYESGMCGYTAFSLLMVYHYLFSSALYFSEQEVSNYILPVVGNPNNKDNVPIVEDSFIGYLNGLYSTAYQTNIFLKKLANLFCANKPVNYVPWSPASYTYKGIKESLLANEPVILCGNLNTNCNPNYDSKIMHDVVIYGFYPEDNKFLTHYGWSNCSQVVLSDYNLSFAFYFENKTQHLHNHLYSDESGEYCACGYKWPTC